MKEEELKKETETEIIIEGNLILTEDFKTTKKLIVKGNILGKNGLRYDINAWNINACDIDAWNINARDINAWNINARDINAWDIDAWNINARDINARDIICERRIKKVKTAKTKARIFITNKSKLERKEW